MKINVVRVSGNNMIEIEREHEGEVSIIRRNVPDYHLLNSRQRKAVWNDIAGLPQVVHTRGEKLDKLKGLLKGRK